MILKVQNLNFYWSCQANFSQISHSLRCKSQIRSVTSTPSPSPYFSSSNLFFRRTLSTSSINKAEPIQFTSLHPNTRIVLPNSTAPPPPPPPLPPSSSSSSSSLLSSLSKAIKSTGQCRAYFPQHFYSNRILDQYVSQSVNTITLRQLVVFGRNLTEERLLRSGNY